MSNVKDHLSIKDKDKSSFKISDLDPLQAGESYELTYKMNITESDNNDGVELIGNTAKSNNCHDDCLIYISKQMVQKSGEVTGDMIKWTVNVNEGEQDLSSYQFTDEIPDGYHLTEGVIVKDKTDWREVPELETGKANDTSISIDVSKVPASRKNHKFQIIYWTNTNDPAVIGETQTITNVAKMKKDGQSYEYPGSVPYQPYTTSKSLEKSTVDGDELINNWQSSLTLSGRSVNEFTYKDTIKNGVDGNNNDLGNDSHYTYADQLYKEISKNILLIQEINGNSGAHKEWKTNTYHNGSDYSWELTCYDASGNKVNNTDQHTHVKSFEVKVTTNKTSVKPTKFTIKYTTIGDISNMAAQEKRDFYNDSEFEKYNHNSTVVPKAHTDSSYTNQKIIEKQASVKGDAGTYQDSLNTKYDELEKSDGKKILHYRIIVDVKEGQTGDLTIKDKLPEGLTYKRGSLSGRFYKSMWDLQDKNYNTKGYDLSDNAYKPAVVESKDKDGNTILTFTIKDGYELSGVKDQRIALDYNVIVSDDPFWNNVKNDSKSYSNYAEWNKADTTQTTTVDRTFDEVSKSVKQLKGKDKRWTNQLVYNLPINPAGKDLNKNGDTLSLVDTLNVPSGVSAYLDLNSVKLYQYDWLNNDHIGDEIDKSLYSFTYDAQSHKITMEVPDEMGLVLTYKYNIDPGSVIEPKVTNSAELGGRYTASTKETSVKVEQASGSMESTSFKIKKVDAKDYSKALAGATFEISKVGKDKGSSYTTNDKGEIETRSLERKVLYQVKETKAPDGYMLNKNTFYVMVIGDEDGASLSDTYEQGLYDQLDSSTQTLVGGKDNITFVGNQGATLLVQDTPSNINIDKSWVDPDGKAITPGASSIHFYLYRTHKILSSVNVNLTINYKDNSSWTNHQSYTIDSGTVMTVRVDNEYDGGTITDQDGHDHGQSYDIGPFTKDTDVTINTTAWHVACDYTKPQLRPDYKNAIIVP